jgi:hypothetical protein
MDIKSTFLKLKPIFFLLLMSFTTFTLVWTVNQFKDSSQFVSANENTKELNSVEIVSPALNESDDTVPQKVEEDNNPIVLSTMASGECSASVIKIDSYSVCTRSGSAEIDYKDGSRSGNFVSKNSTVELVEVSIPLELFSGSDVKDSNRKITTTTPIYKPAGEQLDPKVANVMLPPGTDIIEYKNPVKDRPFSTPYTTSMAEQVSEDGEVIVDKKIINKCEECNNPSNVNPDNSNKSSEFIYESLYKAPGEVAAIDTSKAIESCSKDDLFVHWTSPASDRKACAVSPLAVAVKLVETFSEAIWSGCNGILKYDANGNPIPPSDDCIRPEDIVIKMTSAFGSDKDCPDGVCTNAYMNTRNKVTLMPSESEKYSDKVYYTTDCKVVIEGKRYTVKCAWDMSHLFKERKFSEYDDLPDIEKTPAKEVYKDFLTNEATKRQYEPVVKIY